MYPSPNSPNINALYNHRTIIKTKTLTLVQYYSLKYRLYSDFTNFSTNILFLSQDPILIPTLLSLPHLLRHLLPSGTAPHSFSLSFMILTLLKSTDELVCRITFNSGLPCFFVIILKVLGRIMQRGCFFLKAYQIRLIGTTGNINLDHLVKKDICWVSPL